MNLLSISAVCLLLSHQTALAPQAVAAAGASGGGRVVVTKQGALQGRTVPLGHAGLPDAESFLGIPFASPPVGSLRFMPPASPQSWQGVRNASSFAPVCPQIIPDLDNDTKSLLFMTRGRLNYLKLLFPLLRDQSEDCLYLNVYAPLNKGRAYYNRKLPVVVFVHGESFQWNSGNPYDGSVLAAYNSVIVVTLNYRLGILGFFRPSLGENEGFDVANFGLLDQLAGLHWIRENVGAFGGDAGSLTLVGHGTGAALVTHLMNSPIVKAQDLFHRVVLLSGSAFSPLSLVSDPTTVTKQVSEQVGCSASANAAVLADCLRRKSWKTLLGVQVHLPLHQIPFGPIADGIVIPFNPLESLRSSSLGSYDVILGVTQSESIHMFTDVMINLGLQKKEQEDILFRYLKNIYKRNSSQILSKVLNEYTDFRQVSDSNSFGNRDVVLEAFSDAWVVAPVLEMARTLAENRGSSVYLFVFEHPTENGHYSELFGSVHGEDIPFLLGMPLVGGTRHLTLNYTRQEKLLSEIMMNYLLNFIHTGNVSSFSDMNHLINVLESKRFDEIVPIWPKFTRDDQVYLAFGVDLELKSNYRAHKTSLWIDTIPSIVNSGPSRGGQTRTANSPKYGATDIVIVEATDDEEDEDEEDDDHLNSESRIPNDDGNGGNGNVNKAGAGFGIGGGNGGEASLFGYLLFFGMFLLVGNVCACFCIVYQRRRIKRREESLRQEMRRLSVMPQQQDLQLQQQQEEDGEGGRQQQQQHHTGTRLLDQCFVHDGKEDEEEDEEQHQENDCPECQMAAAANNAILLPRQGPDAMVIDDNDRYRHYQQFYKKSLTDLRRGRRSRSPPEPIIEMIPVSEYERLHGGRQQQQQQQQQVYEQFTFPRQSQRSLNAHYERVPVKDMTRNGGISSRSLERRLEAAGIDGGNCRMPMANLMSTSHPQQQQQQPRAYGTMRADWGGGTSNGNGVSSDVNGVQYSQSYLSKTLQTEPSVEIEENTV